MRLLKINHAISLTPLLIILISCSMGFNVTKSSISGLKENDGFILEKINVSEYKNDLPENFTVDTAVTFMCYNGDCKSNRISFTNKNSSGYWLYWIPLRTEKYDILPITFQENQWYRIRSIQIRGVESEIFMHFNDSGKIEYSIMDASGPY